MIGRKLTRISVKSVSIKKHQLVTSSRYLSSKGDDEANAVVLGGGAVGTSIAYHLAKAGMKNVVLLEAKTIASGSTAHTPGLISYHHTVPRFRRILSYSIDLYTRIQKETGQDVKFHRPGTIRVTRNPKRVDEFNYFLSRLEKDQAELLQPDQIKKLYPLIDESQILCGLYTKGDGYVDTVGLALALSAAAKRQGAKIVENCGIDIKTTFRSDGLWDVETNQGTIKTVHLINASGLWAKDTARKVGLDLPLVHVEHQYALTKPLNPSIENANLPVFHDVDGKYYIRQDKDRLLFGAFEEEQQVRLIEDWTSKGVPKDILKTSIASHFDSVKPNYDAACQVVPALKDAPIEEPFTGVVLMSPDSMPMVGPMLGSSNYWVAVGFFDGISTAGGIGKYLADWIVENEASYELVETDPNRFDVWADRKFRVAKTKESYAFTYALAYPPVSRPAGRPTRRVSGIYGALMEKDATMQFTCGWENPRYIGKDAEKAIKQEYDLVMNNVGVMDFAWLSKVEIRGNDSETLLNYVLANRPPDMNQISYSLMLTPKGRMLSYLRVIHHDSRQSVYLLVGNPDQENRNMRWLQQIAREKKFDVEVSNVTEYLGVIGTGGPNAREVLSLLTKENLSDEKFPHMATRLLRIAGVPVIGCRISESGESGWQLYHNRADSLRIYEALMRAGHSIGIGAIGWNSLNAMRLEKGFKRWGVELNLDANPYEAGVAQEMVDMSKGGFIGFDAMEKLKQKPLDKKLHLISVECSDLPKNYLFGHEKINSNNQKVGRVTSGSFSYVLNKPLCFAYLQTSYNVGDPLSVEVLGKKIEANIVEKPPLLPYHERH